MRVYVRKRCNMCHGHGEIECKACGGDGYNLYGGQCSYCYGLGIKECPNCNGEGHIEEEE